MIEASELNVPLAKLETAQRIRHTAAYIKVNKKDPVWQQLAKLLDAEAADIIHDALNGLKK